MSPESAVVGGHVTSIGFSGVTLDMVFEANNPTFWIIVKIRANNRHANDNGQDKCYVRRLIACF